jgi:hypothetical protein
MTDFKTCTIDGCERKMQAKGLCGSHYQLKRRYGDPLAPKAKYFDPRDALKARTKIADNGCMEWTGSTISDGYGMMKVSGKSMLAHRFSYTQAFGEIPEGQLVLHRCDNPSCVNPDHLFLGTDQDNVSDMFAKGRGRKAKGSGHGRTNLTEDQVRSIRADPRKLRDIAADYGLGKSAVGYIKSRVNWGHIS